MESQAFPVMLSSRGASRRHLTQWEWYDTDPLVVRMHIRDVDGSVIPWEMPRELLIATAVDNEPRAGVEGADLYVEIVDVTALPQAWMLVAALLPEWDQEGEVLLVHMNSEDGQHFHMFFPALWLAPLLERTTKVVANGEEAYDVDEWIAQIFEEAEREKL